jgi:D-glycero-alpha-D-manno-heptose-7-phosphate kinase
VNVAPLTLPSEALANLEDNLLLFFTGTARSASEILRDQDVKSKENAEEMLANLHFMKQLGVESRDALVKGDLRKFAEVCRVDGSALGAQEETLAGDEQRAD